MRRGAALSLVTALAAASTLFVGAGAANALPTGITNPVGVVTPSVVGSTLTLTQTSDRAVLDIADLTLAVGETIDVVQEPGDVLVIRNTGGQASFSGTVTADATLIVSSPTGLV